MANIERVNSEIQKELYVIINNELNDPRIDSIVTIMNVSTTRDLKYSKIYVSSIGSEDIKALVAALNNSAGFLKKKLFSILKIRAVPELQFFVDDSVDYAFKINTILSKLDIKDDE